jgi:hypothetical protein
MVHAQAKGQREAAKQLVPTAHRIAPLREIHAACCHSSASQHIPTRPSEFQRHPNDIPATSPRHPSERARALLGIKHTLEVASHVITLPLSHALRHAGSILRDALCALALVAREAREAYDM